MTAQILDVTSEVPQPRMRGNCKWFDGVRGFGFIGGNDGRDYFVHQTSIKSKGWRNLEVNQEVEFEVVKDRDRLKAINVTSPGKMYVKCEQKKQEHICFEYKKGASCIYGASCKFSHSPPDTVSPDIGRNTASVGVTRSRRNTIEYREHISNLLGGRVSRGVCYSWRRGECHRGNMCRFDHPEDQKNCQFPDMTKGVCYQWQEGKCNKGDRCQFIHFPTE